MIPGIRIFSRQVIVTRAKSERSNIKTLNGYQNYTKSTCWCNPNRLLQIIDLSICVIKEINGILRTCGNASHGGARWTSIYCFLILSTPISVKTVHYHANVEYCLPLDQFLRMASLV